MELQNEKSAAASQPLSDSYTARPLLLRGRVERKWRYCNRSMGYRRRPLSAAVARFFMHIIGIVVYGTAITAARTVGLNSGSGQHNNDTIAKRPTQLGC